MEVQEHGWWSPALGRDMALKVYGSSGRPVVAFPSQDGRYWDFEGWGLVESCAGLIDAGRMRIVAVDGNDWEAWTNWSAHPADRARRHDDYDRYVVTEVAPFLRDVTGFDCAWTTGASMGAYHAANAVFRHPDCFNGLVAMSGLYQLRHFIGEYGDDAVYFHSPLLYLRDLDDPWYLDRLRAASLAFVVGQGAWEDEMLDDTRAMEQVLRDRGVPAIVEYWGHDVDHDWPWWRRMLPYYLERMGV